MLTASRAVLLSCASEDAPAAQWLSSKKLLRVLHLLAHLRHKLLYKLGKHESCRVSATCSATWTRHEPGQFGRPDFVAYSV